MDGKEQALGHFQKVDDPSKLLGRALKTFIFAHKASLGETGINLNSLNQPTADLSGYVSINPDQIAKINLALFKNNVSIWSSRGFKLVQGAHYKIVTNMQIIFLNGYTAEQDEIFEFTVDSVPADSLFLTDARGFKAQAVVAVGQTVVPLGYIFKVNQNPGIQMGEATIFQNSELLVRCEGNVITNPGHYIENDDGTGFGNSITLKNAPAGSPVLLSVINGLMIGQGTAEIFGQLEQIYAALQALALDAANDSYNDNDVSRFLSANPSQVDRRSFGDLVLSILQKNVVASQAFVSAGTIVVGATTTPPTKGGVLEDLVKYRQIGELGEFIYKYRHNSAGGAGSGDYLYSLPSGLAFNLTEHPAFTGAITGGLTNPAIQTSICDGLGTGTDNTNGAILYVIPFDATRFRLLFTTSSTSGSPHSNTSDPYSVTNLAFKLHFRAFITGFAATKTLQNS